MGFIEWVKRIVSPAGKKSAILFALSAFIVGIVIFSLPILTPFLLAALLSFVIEPLVSYLTDISIGKRRLPRWGAVMIIYLISAIILYLFSIFVLPKLYHELIKLLAHGQEFAQKINPQAVVDISDRLKSWIVENGFPIDPNTVDEWIADLLEQLTAEMRDFVTWILSFGQILLKQFISVMFSLLLVFMLTAFMSADVDRIKSFIFSLIPTENRNAYDSLLSRIDSGLSGVVRGQLTICLVNGILTFIGLAFLKVKFALVLSLIAAVFSLVPIFGSISSSIPIVIIAIANPGGDPDILKGIATLGWIVGIHALEANLLNPKIMGDASKIHPVVIVFALIAGQKIYGIIGALLAVPVASVFITIFKFVHKRALDIPDEDNQYKAIEESAPDETRSPG